MNSEAGQVFFHWAKAHKGGLLYCPALKDGAMNSEAGQVFFHWAKAHKGGLLYCPALKGGAMNSNIQRALAQSDSTINVIFIIIVSFKKEKTGT